MLLIRHGESEFNVHFGRTRIDPGIEDPRLTENGIAQVAAAAERLRGETVTRIVTSPYTRALHTAGIIAGVIGAPVEIDNLVRERFHFACDIGTPRSLLAPACGRTNRSRNPASRRGPRPSPPRHPRAPISRPRWWSPTGGSSRR